MVIALSSGPLVYRFKHIAFLGEKHISHASRQVAVVYFSNSKLIEGEGLSDTWCLVNMF